MPLFRQAPASPTDPVRSISADGLLSPEDVADRRVRRYRLLKVGLAVAVLAGGWFAARPTLRAAKSWQSRRAAAQAERLTEAHQWFEARNKLQDALAFRNNEPAALHAAAVFLSATGNLREAAEFWRQLETAQSLTADEQRQFAAALVAATDLDAAETHLHKVWPPGEPGIPADWELGMQLASRRGRQPEADDLARRLLASRATTARGRFNAAATLVASSDAEAQRAGWVEIKALSQDGGSEVALDSLVLLARRAATTAQPAASPELSDLLTRIEAHPLANIRHRLLIIDLRGAQDPSRRSELIQSAVQRFASTSDDADLLVLAAWLYAKGQYEDVLKVIPAARAPSDRALFFQRLDALGALGQWNEIQDAISSRKLALDPMIEQMYLARCADKLDESRARDAHWDAALDAAAGHADKLVQLGQYAAKNGAFSVAARAYQAALHATPDSLPAYEALIALWRAQGDTPKVRETLANMLKIAPHDGAIRNEAAYLDALVGERVPEALATALALVKAEPAGLPPRITLALAELRSDNALAAYDTLAAVNTAGATMQPRQLAVYAAVLWATSYERQARQLISGLPMSELLPEERALIKPIQDDPAR